jgi:hypothetical protein
MQLFLKFTIQHRKTLFINDCITQNINMMYLLI